jgi:hypothetical protein
MRLFALFGAVVVVGMSAAAGAATPSAEAVMPVRAFIDSFNKGDMKGMAAQTSSDGMLIIDEVTPFSWSGPKAFDTWSKALDDSDKAAGNTDAHVTDGKPVHVEVSADRAYVVVPVVYTFKQKDVTMRETAQMALTLQNGKTSWLITGFAWAGTKAKPVVAAAAAAK